MSFFSGRWNFHQPQDPFHLFLPSPPKSIELDRLPQFIHILSQIHYLLLWNRTESRARVRIRARVCRRCFWRLINPGSRMRREISTTVILFKNTCIRFSYRSFRIVSYNFDSFFLMIRIQSLYVKSNIFCILEKIITITTISLSSHR